ncbi:MAG: uroporphyrinogen-III synthase [Rikenellaceae bacterium]|nr:uroporphyrinogen-III synthase [Rikenellaceae bacterium]
MKVNKILVSQPAPAAIERSPFQELITKYGVSVDFQPFIRVERVSVKEFRSQRVDILAHTAIIFTNRSSVDHFFQICEETRVSIPETMKYFCVTEAVALYLQKYIVYRKRKIFFGKAVFADLVDIIVKHKEEKFLLPLPDPHKSEIPATLDKHKLKHTKLILSHTVSNDINGIDIREYNVVVFYSPLEVATLKSTYPELPETVRIAAFGNGTALAVADHGYNLSVIAPTPESSSMVNAIDKFIQKLQSGENAGYVSIEKKEASPSVDNPAAKKLSKKTVKSKVTAKTTDKKSDIKKSTGTVKKAPIKSKSA